MIVIFGGAYQGKHTFATDRFSIKEEEWQTCTADTAALDFSKRAVDRLHLFLLNLTRRNILPEEHITEHLQELQDKIILCDDISRGIVPIEKDLRAWRESTGRTLNLLCQKADEVYQLFCGIPTKLK